MIAKETLNTMMITCFETMCKALIVYCDHKQVLLTLAKITEKPLHNIINFIT